MGQNNFNRRQCVRALEKIGFIDTSQRHGKHSKFTAPSQYQKDNFTFVMVPKHNKLRCQDEIIKELKRMGGDELVEKFRQNL